MLKYVIYKLINKTRTVKMNLIKNLQTEINDKKFNALVKKIVIPSQTIAEKWPHQICTSEKLT